MKDRKGNKAGRKAKLTVVSRSELSALRGCFAEREEWFRPMLGLVENARASIDELMSETVREFVEQLLVLSAQELAGAKHPWHYAGEVCWHGTQAGRIVLAERKPAVKRSRQRRRGPAGKEVAVPVYERLPKELARQVGAVMHAAYRLSEKEGIAKLKQQAEWLKTEYPDAAASLLEGLEETFTVNRLRLTPSLMRCMASTNVMENPNGAVCRVTRRVSRYRDAEMAPRWTATGYLEGEKSFRHIHGHRDLWVLATALGRSSETVDANAKAA